MSKRIMDNVDFLSPVRGNKIEHKDTEGGIQKKTPSGERESFSKFIS